MQYVAGQRLTDHVRDKYAEKSALASEVIESLRVDETLDTEVLRLAIEIATGRGDNPGGLSNRAVKLSNLRAKARKLTPRPCAGRNEPVRSSKMYQTGRLSWDWRSIASPGTTPHLRRCNVVNSEAAASGTSRSGDHRDGTGAAVTSVFRPRGQACASPSIRIDYGNERIR